MSEQHPADDQPADDQPVDETVPAQPGDGLEESAGDGPEESAAGAAAPESAQSTGHDGVDRVLGSLEGLDEQPVDDHVAVFERAHDDLRRALSDAGDQD